MSKKWCYFWRELCYRYLQDDEWVLSREYAGSPSVRHVIAHSQQCKLPGNCVVACGCYSGKFHLPIISTDFMLCPGINSTSLLFSLVHKHVTYAILFCFVQLYHRFRPEMGCFRPLLFEMCLTRHRWTKWPPFRRRHFQVHFCGWKYVRFDSNSTSSL